MPEERSKIFLPSIGDEMGTLKKGPLTLLAYADTGQGKSLQIGRIAYRMWKMTGKVMHYVNWDGGGGLDTIQSYIDAGCIKILDAQEAMTLVHEGKPLSPQTLLRAVNKGYWHPFTSRNGKIIAHKLTPEEMANVGAYAFESIDSICNAIKAHYILTSAKVGSDLVYTSSESSLDGTSQEKYGKIGLSHFGGAQDFILGDFLPSSQALPVELVIYTSHEARGTDELGTGDTVVGPLALGRAATKPLMKSVSLLMHFDKALIPGKPASVGVPAVPATQEYRAFYLDHRDYTNDRIVWKSQPRVDPMLLPELESKFPGGYIKLLPGRRLAPVDPGQGLDDFLLYRNELQRSLAESLKGA